MPLSDPLGNALDAFLLTLPALISIINPIGAALIFSQVAAGRPDHAGIVNRVSLYSLAVMLGALWTGSYVMTFFGITLPALRIAGGLVIAIRAWTLLTAPEAHEARKTEEAQARRQQDDISFFPLTMPFTTGPGTISVIIALGAERPLRGLGVVSFFGGATAACVAMAGIIWLAYRFSDRVVALLGERGARTVTRLIAFLLLCIGTQIVITGMTEVIGPLLKQ